MCRFHPIFKLSRSFFNIETAVNWSRRLNARMRGAAPLPCAHNDFHGEFRPWRNGCELQCSIVRRQFHRPTDHKKLYRQAKAGRGVKSDGLSARSHIGQTRKMNGLRLAGMIGNRHPDVGGPVGGLVLCVARAVGHNPGFPGRPLPPHAAPMQINLKCMRTDLFKCAASNGPVLYGTGGMA